MHWNYVLLHYIKPSICTAGSPGPNSFYCRSPSFRKTPGASRPSPYTPSSRGSPPWSSRDNLSSVLAPLSLDKTPSSDKSWSESCDEEDAASGTPGSPPIQLMVANLDYNISAREWKKILYTEFQQHVQVGV